MKKMIDTIVLIIPKGYIPNPLEYDRFRPSIRGLFDKSYKSKGYDKYVQNPTKEDQKSGYKPRLAIYQRYYPNEMQIPLKIEFSIPKLLNGNNIVEVKESDFNLIIKTLQERLKQMGIQVFAISLANAFVSAIHFSKNFILEDYATTSMILKDLSKIDLTKRLKLNYRHFQNDGQALYLDSDSYQIVFYDKIADINQTKRHKIDKDPTPQQESLFEVYKKQKNPKEILRYEIRIAKKAKLKSLLKEIGFDKELTFQNLFNRDLSRQILQYYWKKFIEDESYMLILLDDKPDRVFQKINENAKCRISLEKNLALTASSILINKFGMQGAREIIETKYHTRTWARFRDNTLKKNLPKASNSVSYIKYITEALDKFEPVSLSDIGLNEFDNVKESKV
jgi:hypothetical protein